jgi:hypothetical protein
MTPAVVTVQCVKLPLSHEKTNTLEDRRPLPFFGKGFAKFPRCVMEHQIMKRNYRKCVLKTRRLTICAAP